MVVTDATVVGTVGTVGTGTTGFCGSHAERVSMDASVTNAIRVIHDFILIFSIGGMQMAFRIRANSK